MSVSFIERSLPPRDRNDAPELPMVAPNNSVLAPSKAQEEPARLSDPTTPTPPDRLRGLELEGAAIDTKLIQIGLEYLELSRLGGEIGRLILQCAETRAEQKRAALTRNFAVLNSAAIRLKIGIDKLGAMAGHYQRTLERTS